MKPFPTDSTSIEILMQPDRLFPIGRRYSSYDLKFKRIPDLHAGYSFYNAAASDKPYLYVAFFTRDKINRADLSDEWAAQFECYTFGHVRVVRGLTGTARSASVIAVIAKPPGCGTKR